MKEKIKSRLKLSSWTKTRNFFVESKSSALIELYTGRETSTLNIFQNDKIFPNFAQDHFQIAEEKDMRLVSLSVLNSFKDKFLESKEKLRASSCWFCFHHNLVYRYRVEKFVHTMPEKFDNAASLLRLDLPSSVIRHGALSKTLFKL